MNNERILVSRNKREGRYIAGWCYNPKLCKHTYRATGMLVEVKGHRRAGADRDLDVEVVRNARGVVIGKTFYRVLRGV